MLTSEGHKRFRIALSFPGEQYSEIDRARERLDKGAELVERCGYGRRPRDVELWRGSFPGVESPGAA